MKLPKVLKVQELPQWIIESDKAAYHPHTNTIYLTKWVYLPHELLHWIACGLHADWAHKIIDWRRIIYDRISNRT